MGIATPQQQQLDSPSNASPAPPPAPPDRKIADWIFSHDIPSDVSVVVDGVSYALHKFPLIARSGWMRRIVAEAKESELSLITLPEFPGGAETFELVAKFCYGMSESFAIDAKNVAALRCAAEYLDMAEIYATGNLVALTEAYLVEEAVNSIQACVLVLKSCENLLPLAEELGIVSICVDAAARRAAAMDPDFAIASSPNPNRRIPLKLASPPPEPWIDDLSLLRIDFFHRIISSMKSLHMVPDTIASAISQYSQHALKPLMKNQNSLPKLKLRSPSSKAMAELKLQRLILETLVGMMPGERCVFSVGFLLAMLKVAIFLDAPVSCRLDLERRIGLQLEQATVDDLLLPLFSYSPSDTLFDIDTISRIVVSFLQQDKDEEQQIDASSSTTLFDGTDRSSDRLIPHSRLMKVARLLDSFLAEVAPDANLTVSKFVGFAEMMPDYARVVDDGLYRAIDVYIKAHPGLGDLDRRTICSLMNCQKLSQEACRHASQNERLPVQVTVQVLYFEQMRLRNTAGAAAAPAGGGGAMSEAMSPKDRHYMVAMQRENMELKMEVNRLMTRLGTTASGGVSERELSEDEEDDEEEDEQGRRGGGRRGISMASGERKAVLHILKRGGKTAAATATTASTATADMSAAPLPLPSPSPAERGKSRFFQSVSKTLGKLNPFSRNSSSVENGGLKSSRPSDIRTSRRPRRHSIS